MLGTGALPATAQEDPPAGDIKNFEFIRNLSGMNSITSINVMSYGSGDVVVAVGRFGVRTFDLSDPTDPQALDHLRSDDLMLDTESAGTFWQSESTNVDQKSQAHLPVPGGGDRGDRGDRGLRAGPGHGVAVPHPHHLS